MSPTGRVRRRPYRLRPRATLLLLRAPAPAPVDSGLLAHLAGTPARGGEERRLQAAALHLLEGGEPVRLGLRAGELAERIAWFERLLRLWPIDRAHDWMQLQLQISQSHPMAGAPLHDALDSHLFDPGLDPTRRQRLWALWLAVVAPGAVCLDAARREHESRQALCLMNDWLAAQDTHARAPL